MVAKREEHLIALFFTGRNHAGENVEKVLERRSKALSGPIQRRDGLSRNLHGELKTILANCLSRGRRRFVDVAENLPQEVRYVLKSLAQVYENDAVARREQLSPQQRLEFHQRESGPLIQKLHEWLKRQSADKTVEPNSGLGEAISYMLGHWKELTLFLRKPGAPLDDSICERVLRKAILHRKNSLFYKTQNGAQVGDIFISLIHTAELSGANPFDYLCQLQRHARQLRENPGQWKPWKYRETLKRISNEALHQAPD